MFFAHGFYLLTDYLLTDNLLMNNLLTDYWLMGIHLLTGIYLLMGIHLLTEFVHVAFVHLVWQRVICPWESFLTQSLGGGPFLLVATSVICPQKLFAT